MYILIIITIVSLLIYKLVTINKKSFLSAPNLMSMTFYRDFIFLTMIPYIYYYYNNRYLEHYILKNIQKPIYFYYAAFSALFFIIIFLFSFKTFEKIFNFFTRRIVITINYQKLTHLLRTTTLIFLIITLYSSYYYETGIFGLFTLNSKDLEIKRHLLSHSDGILKLNKIFIKSWVPILSYLFLYVFITKKIKSSNTNKIYLTISILNGLLASLFFLEKATTFFYIFGFFGVFAFSGKEFKKYHLLWAFIFSIILIGLMYLITYGNKITGLYYLKDIIIHRTATQSVGSIMAFDYFEKFDFKGLSGISNFLASILNKNFSSPYSDIIKYYEPESAETSGSMSSFVTGEAYGLFGILGIIFSGLIVGLWYSFFESTKNSNFLGIIFVGVYGIYFSQHIVASSFYSFVWPIGLVFDILPFVFLTIFCIKKSN